MKVLLTGGAGFIGSHVAEAYLEEGHEVIVVDNLSTGRAENLPSGVRFYLLDINSQEVRKLVSLEKPDIINHQAAQISVPLSVQDPVFDAKVNVLGTINLLEAAAEAGVKRFVFASTGGAIYGDTSGRVAREELPPNPESPYAQSKLGAEGYIKLLSKGRFSFAILRYSNVYGPRQIPHGEAGVVAIFSIALLEGKPVRIYTYPEMERGMVRDYVYVKDVARANVLASQGEDNVLVNISTGRPTTTLELLEKLMEVSGLRVDYEIAPPRPGDIRYSVLSPEKAREVLGWRPLTSLEKGLRCTFEFFRAESGR